MQPYALNDMIKPTSKVILQMARRMRMRPETMFQLLSDALDESVQAGTLHTDDKGLHFETCFASVTLTPSSAATEWNMSYKTKEAMLTVPALPHSIDVFSVPSRSDIFISHSALNQLRQRMGSCEELQSNQLVSQILDGWQTAAKAWSFPLDDFVMAFNTGLRDKEDTPIFGVLEPAPYQPIPNTWELSIK